MPTYLWIFLMKSAAQAFTEKWILKQEGDRAAQNGSRYNYGSLVTKGTKLKRNAWEKRKEQEGKKTHTSTRKTSLSKIVIKKQMGKWLIWKKKEIYTHKQT